MLLEGLLIPLATPFYPDGRVYLRKLEHNVERYGRTPAAGLALLTPSGEPERLSDDERRDVLRTAAAIAPREKVLLADVSCPGVRETLRLAEAAALANFDVCLVRVGGRSLAEQRLFLQTVADSTPLPLVLWGVDEEDLLIDAAHWPGVLGAVAGSAQLASLGRVAERTHDVSRDVTVTTIFAAVTGRMQVQEAPAGGQNTFVLAASLAQGSAALAVVPPVPAIKTRTRRVGFQWIADGSDGMLALLRAGAKAAMPAFAACAPQAAYEVYAAWKDGDEALAENKLERMRGAAARIEGELGVAGIKAASDLTGYYGGRPRLPGLPLRGDELLAVEALMRGMRH